MSVLLEDPRLVFPASVLMRVGMLFYGLWQDQNSALKYTDIDYYVFTDAARFTSRGLSPYLRDTYRYTPFLAWILQPTAWSDTWFHSGKALFALGDVLTGWLIVRILQRSRGFTIGRATKYASIWLLNPMVATISTRGSSEGFLAFTVMMLLEASIAGQDIFAGCLLGFAVHFKIYPFIYAFPIFWALGPSPSKIEQGRWPATLREAFDDTTALVTLFRIRLALSSTICFIFLNVVMYLKSVATLSDPIAIADAEVGTGMPFSSIHSSIT